MSRPWIVVPLVLACAGCAAPGHVKGGAGVSGGGEKGVAVPFDDLRRRRDRYADVEITVDESTISAADMAVLPWLVKAAEVMDELFWKQSCASCPDLRRTLAERAHEGPYWKLLHEYVEINYGPYDRLDGDEAFFGKAPKPRGATFYPSDMTRSEFDGWLEAHPDDSAAFHSPFTVIARDQGGALRAVPYSEYYRKDLEEAAGYLRRAAGITSDRALKRYLESRAEAFVSNDYFQSDMDWMDLGSYEGPGRSALDVTIGPYEVYEDRLMNLKAAFEAFVTLRDRQESRKLSLVSGYLDELEANLPIDDSLKNFARGKASPIVVVNVVYTAGDTRAGVQTTAFNLPNDERVRAAKGSKKVLLKNVGEAKFRKSLVPIAGTLLQPDLLPLITFDAYFNGILMHEVSHGLGPGVLSLPDGTKTTVNVALKETYSAIEECKADVLGVYNTLHLVDRGVFPAELKARTEAVSLAGIFRSVRFGIGEAHGLANMIQYNYLKEKGAFVYDPATGRFGVDGRRFEAAVRALAHDLLTIQARGDYQAARRFIDRYGAMPDEVTAALSRLRDVPVDIKPTYTLGDKLLGRRAG